MYWEETEPPKIAIMYKGTKALAKLMSNIVQAVYKVAFFVPFIESDPSITMF